MNRGGSDSRIRWAFVLAVLLHAGALAIIAHVPLAQASGAAFDEITVFGADAPFAGSLVTLVELPASGPASPGPAAREAPLPVPEKQYEAPPAPPSPPRAEHQAGRGLVRPETPGPPSTGPAPQPPAATAPAGKEGQSGPPAAVGTPSASGTGPSPEVSGGERSGTPPGPDDGGVDDGSPTGTPATGDGGGGGNGQTGDRGGRSGSGGSGLVGGSEGLPGASSAAVERVEWANPKVLRTVQPTYPQSAAANGVEGTVVMKVLVGEQGRVVEAEVLRSSHDARLDKAALTAVRQWRFEPATQDGKAHPVYARASVTFKLP